ncbi:phycobilisome rod-core linker polypeptide [Phormidium sp. CCY1219]|uniref:phycobilisome rod-core linker polypeptide n=1 Tax=Phormidium sp. CCY1219 TaxID=2886104 RepID=UPI003FA72811
MDPAKGPLMASAMASESGKLDAIAVGRSVSGSPLQRPSANQVSRIYRVSATMSAPQMEEAIAALYRQVMDIYSEEIPEAFRIDDLEAGLIRREISVRDFVRGLANSDAYRDRFVTPYPTPKAVELLFRHLLGRTPATPELSDYEQLLGEEGLESTVSTLLDGAEYTRYFGENVVPYRRS